MMSSELAIQTTNLTKRFGANTVLKNVNLNVPVGSVFAFLGTNGAGKTTTIHILLDILDRTSGEAKILGLDCVRQSLEIKRRIGFVAEGQSMYDWMTVDEIIRFCKRFYPAWDDTLADDLKYRYELPGELRVGELSRGMRGKLALLLAMAYRPELLIFDEPTSGLDVIVRHDFLKGVIDHIQEDGRTVFFSTHQVSEVEKIADWVGIIDHGELICCSSMEDLKENVKRVVVTFDNPKPISSDIPDLLRVEKAGRQASLTVRSVSQNFLAAINKLNPSDIRVEDLSLERIFMDMVS